MSRDDIRIGLIGAGKHGRRYANHICNDIPQMRLVAICRRNLEAGRRFASELGCRYHADFREVVAADDIDAVVVVAQAMRHAEMAEAAVRAGRAVLLEKPAVARVDQAGKLRRALRDKPVPFMVAQTLRYNAVVRALYERLTDIGAIHAISLTQRFERSSLAWLDDPECAGGGITLHTGVHSFDLMRHFTGRGAERVLCRMTSVHTQRTEDNFAATIELAGGVGLASVSGSRAAPGRVGSIEIAGEHATLVGDHVTHRAERIVGTRAEPIPVAEPVPTVREALRDFVRVVRGEQLSPISLEDGLRAVAVADACYRSARSGRVESVRRIGEEPVEDPSR